MKQPDLEQFNRVVEQSKSVLIVQADNPDGDSLGSALALEAIFSQADKSVYLYCAVDMPNYLKYLEGWSRVSKDLPSEFDSVIIVDASTKTLFEKAGEDGTLAQFATKPCIVLDHHAETSNDIEFARVVINDPSVSSTCELIFNISKTNGWSVPEEALPALLTGILGDTQGLSNQLATADTYRVVADMIQAGANRPALEEVRRLYSKMPELIFRYKAKLIERTELHANSRVAIVSVTQDEINTYSPLYNPGPLIQNDMLQVEGVKIGIVCKVYSNGRITGMIRSNPGAEVASKLAVNFGGGGHGFAAGFRIEDGRSYSEVKSDCIKIATELLDALNQGNSDESTQYAYTIG